MRSNVQPLISADSHIIPLGSGELFGTLGTERAVIDRLSRLSVYDCLHMASQLSARLYFEAAELPKLIEKGIPIDATPANAYQLFLVKDLANETDLVPILRAMVGQPHPRRVLIFERQLLHFERLALLHASHRKPNHISQDPSAEILRTWLEITDLLRPNDPNSVSTTVQQYDADGTTAPIVAWSMYYDILLRLWPSVSSAVRKDPEDAFRGLVGIGIEEYFAMSLSIMAHFGGYMIDARRGVAIDPNYKYGGTKIGDSVWRPYFDHVSRDLAEMHTALKSEEQRYGATTYRSVTLASTPILANFMGRYLPLSLPELQRSGTEGVIFILGDGGQNEHGDRGVFTAPFGAVFQEYVQKAFERMQDRGVPGDVRPEFKYGKENLDTSDVFIIYDHDIVVVEVVSGQLQAATRTRGDLDVLANDLAKLVTGKAGQLHKCICNYRDGQFEIPGIEVNNAPRIWPVIVSSIALPISPPLTSRIDAELKRCDYLQGNTAERLSVLSAEELAFAEGAVDRKTTFLDLIRGWKGRPGHRDHSLHSYLDATTQGNIPVAQYHHEVFAEASDRFLKRFFDGPSLRD
jgi:hypothetical protein